MGFLFGADDIFLRRVHALTEYCLLGDGLHFGLLVLMRAAIEEAVDLVL